MEVTPVKLALALAAVVAAGVPWCAVVALVRAVRPQRPISECLLAACVIIFLGLVGEVYLVSAVPVDRPLRFLPHAHALLALVLVVVSFGPRWRMGWRQAARDAVGSLAHLFGVCTWPVRLAAAATLLLLAVCLAYGAYSVPGTWDELEYHVPQAVQPYQDGRVGPVTSDLPWANAYPRGVELLWYWTLQWSGTDLLFHPVQFAFGLQLLLAAYVLARRSGVGAEMAVLVTIVLASMPLFFILTTCGYIDSAVGAAVVTVVAFLAPPRTHADSAPPDWLLAGLALGQSCLMKLPLLTVALGSVSLLHVVLFRLRPREGLRSVLRFALSTRGAATFVVVALCCHTYLQHWIERGNPFYPLRIALGDRVLFDGPLDAALIGMGGHTTMGRVAEMTRFQRFWAAWADLYQPLTVDSFGGFGPVFVVAVLFLFLVFAVHALIARATWHLTLVLMFSLCFATPSYLPRYGLPMITLAVIGAAWVLAQLPISIGRAATAGVLILCAFGAGKSVASMRAGVGWVVSQAGGTLPLRTRNAFLFEMHPVGLAECYCSPGMIRFIRDRSGPGDVLVWNVRTFAGLLWNRTYSNRVVHLAGTPSDVYPRSAAQLAEPTPEELRAWLATIVMQGPKHVLVYARSAYARALDSDSSLGYKIVYRDAEARGPGAMVLFERAGGRSAQASYSDTDRLP